MKQIIVAASIFMAVLGSQLAQAQNVSGRISMPGFSLKVGNTQPYYGYNNNRGDAGNRQIAMQQAKLRDMKRMAWSDGYLSFREKRMIREEENQLDWMMNNRRRY